MIIGHQPGCDFHSLQEGIDYIEKKDPTCRDWHTVYILEGIYKEQVTISQSNLALIGIGEVIISHNAYARQTDEQGQEIGTFKTATVYIDGENVHLKNMTIENTAGAGEVVGQALALYANCDKSTFKNCRFLGHQDTLFTAPLPDKQKDQTDFNVKRPKHKAYRQYYQQCVIEGTVDYIFGGATAYFDHCLIKNKARLLNDQPGYVTAACTHQGQEYGFIFNDCFIYSEQSVESVYLGRPWRPYAKVRFQQCKMDASIHPERWHDWNNRENRKTATFEEYGTIQATKTHDTLTDWTTFEEEGDDLSPGDIFHHNFYKL